MTSSAPASTPTKLAKAQIEYAACPPLPNGTCDQWVYPYPFSSIKGIAQRLYASEIFPLASVKFMLMTWQASPQVIDDVKDPDDEGPCPGADGGEVDEEEYNR